ncbi:hypothetical protein [Endozoicomonas euniceicola]|uniref:Uncharacterized protein n=1 Tax=Endozoicomonas euniceicola TaxID=1234143 RepID=A0ABY6GRH2_9GAMM|nr:hypothetical protein [Endozoicomonas euniceicola]UYM15350.1 hypothetical protein NX720_21235 [Endozoicomonas euniceicola]
MRTFCQCFLLISFLLQSLSVNAAPAPFAHELKNIEEFNSGRTIDYLSQYEKWAYEQGYSGVYNWLHSKLPLDGYTCPPIKLLGTNAHAVWWFIRHSMDEEALTADNKKIQELAMMALKNCRHRSANINTQINRLLQSAFNIDGNHVLGEVLLNLIISDVDLTEIPIYYDKLFKNALVSRNYRLVNLLLKRIDTQNTPHYIGLILRQLLTNFEIWEEPSTEELSYDYEDLAHDVNQSYSGSSTFYANPYYSHIEHIPSEFNRILNWLQKNRQQNPTAFQEALAQARQYRHQNAIDWLTPICITEIPPQTEPETESKTDDTSSTNAQPRPQSRSVISFIMGIFCLKRHFLS